MSERRPWKPSHGTVEDDLRSRLACIAETTGWDRPYEERMAAIRGMCDLTTNGMTPQWDAMTTPTPPAPAVDLCHEFIDTGRCGHTDAEHDAMSAVDEATGASQDGGR